MKHQPELFPELPWSPPEPLEVRVVEVKHHQRKVKARQPGEARQRKDQGQQLAAAKTGSDWFTLMLALLPQYLLPMKTDLFTFDGYRSWCEEGKHPAPASLNAWGSLPRMACKVGYCEPTGTYEKATRPESHGRAVAVWRALV